MQNVGKRQTQPHGRPAENKDEADNDEKSLGKVSNIRIHRFKSCHLHDMLSVVEW